MAAKESSKLFSEFAPNTMQEWIDKVTADLKGADFSKKLVWKTNEGFSVQPMYRLENMESLQHLNAAPGEYPYVRGNKKENNNWFVRQNIVVEDLVEANEKALKVLNSGVDSLGFVFSTCAKLTKEDMAVLLKDIALDCIEINFVVRCPGKIAEAFLAYVEEKGYDKARILGGASGDPLTRMLTKGSDCCEDTFNHLKAKCDMFASFPNFKIVEVGGHLFNNSGSSIVQELGYSLAAGVEYLDKLTNAGMTLDAAASTIRFHFATSSKYFMEIAKLRAARYLWAQIVKAYNPSNDDVCRMNIHASTSTWNKTVYDPNVNMLRTQTETMSAVLGGVDSFTVNPFDSTFECNGTELSERVARNQQLLLKEESHFEKIVDAAGGSYYIEELTNSIAEEAWKLFLAVQEEGGFIAACTAGSVQKAIKATASARDLAIATRRENLVGVNQFPNFTEVLDRPLCSCVFETECCNNEDAVMETLTPYRGAAAFEALRLKTDTFAKKNGRPVVYMIPMGNLAMRKARAQFACNFFACAGFDVRDNNGFKTVEEGVAAALENKAAIVVLCSSDDEYATLAPEVYSSLKDTATVVVAGNPECRADLEAVGIINFVHVRNNVLEELTRYQSEIIK